MEEILLDQTPDAPPGGSAPAPDGQDEQQTNQRLEKDFLTLTSEFPGRFKELADLPKEVVEKAKAENLSLFDSYLRYRHRQAQMAAAEQKRRAQAAEWSAGSLSGDNRPQKTELDLFEQAFYQALR